MSRARLSLPAAVLVALAVSGVARAQEPTLLTRPIVIVTESDGTTAEQQKALVHWLADMKKWQRFDRHWHNEPAHGVSGRIAERMTQPPPPDWVARVCARLSPREVATASGRVGQACRLLAGLSEDLVAVEIAQQTQAAQADKERPAKGTFFSRVHLDGLWSTTSSDVRYYGLIGTHISLVDIGRVQFFGPPGIILLSIPDGYGSRTLRPGYTWGMSVRLTDFHFPGSGLGKNATLFLNVTKCWTVGQSALAGPNLSGFDIAGFSIAPRKNRH
jgi:hypothetical protein